MCTLFPAFERKIPAQDRRAPPPVVGKVDRGVSDCQENPIISRNSVNIGKAGGIKNMNRSKRYVLEIL